MESNKVFRRQDGALYQATSANSTNDSELVSIDPALLKILPVSGKSRTQDFVDNCIDLVRTGAVTPEWLQEQNELAEKGTQANA